MVNLKRLLLLLPIYFLPLRCDKNLGCIGGSGQDWHWPTIRNFFARLHDGCFGQLGGELSCVWGTSSPIRQRQSQYYSVSSFWSSDGSIIVDARMTGSFKSYMKRWGCPNYQTIPTLVQI